MPEYFGSFSQGPDGRFVSGDPRPLVPADGALRLQGSGRARLAGAGRGEGRRRLDPAGLLVVDRRPVRGELPLRLGGARLLLPGEDPHRRGHPPHLLLRDAREGRARGAGEEDVLGGGDLRPEVAAGAAAGRRGRAAMAPGDEPEVVAVPEPPVDLDDPATPRRRRCAGSRRSARGSRRAAARASRARPARPRRPRSTTSRPTPLGPAAAFGGERP